MTLKFDCEIGPIGLPHISPVDFVEKTDSTKKDAQLPCCTNTSVSHGPTPKQRNIVSLAQSLSETRVPGETGLVEIKEAGTAVSTGLTNQSNKNSYSEAKAVILGVTHSNR